ncbi:MAG: hypothetical protein JMN27_12680 [gamma proteobacterium endosymbiont of Lamellibrachia anaximandri]|nr:hypothetical protein [gamma proteobacterium endosymbiont of Lamellibrachia anaximandri]MBL3534676.1 hypothetical protein [gamma proteobacterium endosymbiont of Lamellibrachia anaximandri]
MKKKLAALSFLLVSLVLSGMAVGASIVGSSHDLTGTGVSASVCVFCHTPHNASTTNLTTPLWNRVDTTSTFQMYDSPTFDMSPGAGSQPAGVSLACLSCHDGSLSVDQLLNPPADFVANANTVGGLGTDLRNDHPISFGYNVGLDPAFEPAVTVVAAGLPLFGAAGDQVECGTCHNVHDPAIGKFLRISNTASAMCTACHIK